MARRHYRQRNPPRRSSRDYDDSSDNDLQSDDGYDSASTSGSIDSESEDEFVSNYTTSPRRTQTRNNYEDSNYDSSDNEGDYGRPSRQSPSPPPRRYPALGRSTSRQTYNNRSSESLGDVNGRNDCSDSDCDCQARSPGPRTSRPSAYTTNSDPYLSTPGHRYPDQRGSRSSGRRTVDSASRRTTRRAYSDETYRRSSGRGYDRDGRSRRSRGGNEDRSRRRERYREPRYSRDSDDEGARQGRLARIMRLSIRALGSGLGG